MNAVNLIPLESRRGEASLPGLPFLGLVGALGLALAGSVTYVEARNNVSTQQGELTHIQAGTAEWNAVAAHYAPAVTALKQHDKRYVQLGALLGERADWSLVLGQLAGVMPAHAELSSLTASASGATGGTTSGATSTTSATGTGAAASGIDISGCAASQSVVADTMVALRRMSGVSSVNLSSSALQSSGSGGGASSGSAGGSGCTLPVEFSVTLQFTPPNPLVQRFEGASASGATGSSATATQTSTAVPTAASSSDSTGATQ